jgi:hypothetical protein
VKIGHFFPFQRKLLRCDLAISEGLDRFKLLNQKVIERIDLWSLISAGGCSWYPFFGDFQVVLPVGNSGLQGKFTKMPNAGHFGISPMPLGVSNSLPPAVEKDGDGTNDRSANYPSPGSKESNGFQILLFFWGHDWWILTVWWGFLAALLLVHLDFMWGAFREILYFRANGEWWHPLPGAPVRFRVKGSNHGSISDSRRVAGCPPTPCWAFWFRFRQLLLQLLLTQSRESQFVEVPVKLNSVFIENIDQATVCKCSASIHGY